MTLARELALLLVLPIPIASIAWTVTHEEVDHESLGRLVHESIDAGAVGIVALGTTGEAHALDHDELSVRGGGGD